MNKPVSVSSNVSVRVGIDLVAISKIKSTFENREALQATVFTPVELGNSRKRKSPYAFLAARFAVKEALFKALGTGLSGEMSWLDVEIWEEVSEPPSIFLSGRTAQAAEQKGVVGHFLSLAHTRNYAIALVLLVLNGRAGAFTPYHRTPRT